MNLRVRVHHEPVRPGGSHGRARDDFGQKPRVEGVPIGPGGDARELMVGPVRALVEAHGEVNPLDREEPGIPLVTECGTVRVDAHRYDHHEGGADDRDSLFRPWRVRAQRDECAGDDHVGHGCALEQVEHGQQHARNDAFRENPGRCAIGNEQVRPGEGRTGPTAGVRPCRAWNRNRRGSEDRSTWPHRRPRREDCRSTVG